MVAMDDAASLPAPQLTEGRKQGLRERQHPGIQNNANESYRHNIGKHEVGTQRLLLTNDTVAEAFRISYHFGNDCQHKCQTKTDTCADDNRRHRCRQNDTDDDILATETKGPPDVI